MNTGILLIALYLIVGAAGSAGGLLALRYRSRYHGLAMDSARWSRAWFLAIVAAALWPAALVLVFAMLHPGVLGWVIDYVSDDHV